MGETPSKPELLRSLGKLARGLSALFWGLPLTLIVYMQTAEANWFTSLGFYSILLPPLPTLLDFFGIMQMNQFQKQERIWTRSLDISGLLLFTNLGLSPFLYWWHRVPFVPLFSAAVALLALSSLAFLFQFNYVLQRLAAMLPDQTLRQETRVFGAFNRSMLVAIPILVVVFFLLNQIKAPPRILEIILRAMEPPLGLWFLIFLLLIPLAMTMALIWKMKETILAGVFNAEE
jgi:hypothetical protein